VPQDRPAVFAGDLDPGNLVAIGQWGRQIAKLSVDPGGDHGARRRFPGGSVLKGVAGGRASVHHMLAAGEGDVKLLG
jgi:hypothetical protein